MLDWGSGADIALGAFNGFAEFAFWMAKFTFYLKIGLVICVALLAVKAYIAWREQA